MLIARHGGDSHYVRPDRVYRTGVLSPIVGFQPQADVMAVAREFTQGPYAFQQGSAGTMVASGVAGPRVTLLGGLGGPVQLFGSRVTLLGGLRDVSNLGWVQRTYLKLKAWFAARKAGAVVSAAGVHGLGISTTRALNGLIPYGPAQWAANQVMPGPNNRMQMLVAMQAKNQPETIGMNNSDALLQRFNYMRSPNR